MQCSVRGCHFSIIKNGAVWEHVPGLDGSLPRHPAAPWRLPAGVAQGPGGYAITEEQAARIRRNFGYHRIEEPRDAERIEELRSAFASVAVMVCEATPAGREQSLALTELEVGLMHAVSAIAREWPVERDPIPHVRPSSPVEEAR